MLRLPSIDALTPAPSGCPWTTDGLDGNARALFAPRDSAELAAVLTDAARRSIPVVPVGSGSQLDHLPGHAHVVWTAHLTRILDHQPDDLTITVQSGTPLTAIQHQLWTARQHLPHRPCSAGTATIGGLLASHRPGLTRLGHGPLRDRVLGMTVALSSGDLASSGGRVVKNVAGYDLHRLHVGAHGTLGVITQVTLKVSPLPAGRTLLVAPLTSPEAAARFATALARTPLLPTAILASAHLTGAGPAGIPLTDPLLWVTYEDVDAGRDRAVRDTAELARSHGLPAFSRHETTDLPPDLADLAPSLDIELCAYTPRGTAHLLLTALSHRTPAVIDLGEAMLRATFQTKAFSTIRHLTDRIRAAGGWSTVTRAPPDVWPTIRAARPPVPTEPRMLAVRRALDPAGIMHPDRLLEGLL